MSRERRFLRSIIIAIFSLLAGILLVFPFDPVKISQVFAMGKPLPYDDLHITRCLTQKTEGNFSPDESRYKFSGICTVFLDKNPYGGGKTGESTFENEKPCAH